MVTKRSVLIFGPSGAGKTTFMGWTALDPRTSPALFLDMEANTASLFGLPDGLTVVRIKNLEDLSKQFNYLANGDKVVEVETSNMGKQLVDYTAFKSVIIDSITELYLFTLTGQARERALEQKRKGNAERDDQDAFELRDYGVALNQIRRVLRYFRDLPIHFFATCLSKADLMTGEGRITKPDLPGILAEEIVAMFNVVAFLTISKDKEVNRRILFLHSYPGLRVKFQTPWGTRVPEYFNLGEKVENPVSELLNLMKIPEGEN